MDGHNVFAGTTTHSGGTSSFNFYGSNPAAPVQRSQSPTPKPCSTVPFPPDPDFIDRPEILEWMLSKSAWPAARIALVGLGGIGYGIPVHKHGHSIR